MKWKRTILVVVILAALLAGVCEYLTVRGRLEQASKSLKSKDVILERWRTEAGANKTLSEAQRVTIKELKAARGLVADSLREAHGSIKNLNSAIRVLTSSSGSLTTTLRDTVVITNDSIREVQRVFEWSDQWLSLDGRVGLDSLWLNYSLSNDIAIDTKWRRDDTQPRWKFWKPKTLYVETTSANPNTTVNRIQTFIVQPEPRRWYQTRGFQISAGFAAGYLLGNR